MIQVPPTTTITFDDKVFEVAKMSKEIQQLITYFDDWRQREQELASDLMMVRSAQRDLQNTLLAQVQEELKPKVEEAAPAVETPPATVSRTTRGRK